MKYVHTLFTSCTTQNGLQQMFHLFRAYYMMIVIVAYMDHDDQATEDA
jgi:hypothetical protein